MYAQAALINPGSSSSFVSPRSKVRSVGCVIPSQAQGGADMARIWAATHVGIDVLIQYVSFGGFVLWVSDWTEPTRSARSLVC